MPILTSTSLTSTGGGPGSGGAVDGKSGPVGVTKCAAWTLTAMRGTVAPGERDLAGQAAALVGFGHTGGGLLGSASFIRAAVARA